MNKTARTIFIHVFQWAQAPISQGLHPAEGGRVGVYWVSVGHAIPFVKEALPITLPPAVGGSPSRSTPSPAFGFLSLFNFSLPGVCSPIS